MPDPYDLLMSEDNQLYIRHLVIDANNLDLNTISEYLQFAIELQLQKIKLK